MSTDYLEALHRIATYLTEDNKEATYILNCFFNQDEHDFEEMALAEKSSQVAEKYAARMNIKKEGVAEVKSGLTYFKNEEFKNRVAELCQWCNFQLNKPKIFENKFPRDLKIFLREIKRYNGDLLVMGSDINRRFKFLSPAPNLPAK